MGVAAVAGALFLVGWMALGECAPVFPRRPPQRIQRRFRTIVGEAQATSALSKIFESKLKRFLRRLKKFEMGGTVDAETAGIIKRILWKAKSRKSLSTEELAVWDLGRMRQQKWKKYGRPYSNRDGGIYSVKEVKDMMTRVDRFQKGTETQADLAFVKKLRDSEEKLSKLETKVLASSRKKENALGPLTDVEHMMERDLSTMLSTAKKGKALGSGAEVTAYINPSNKREVVKIKNDNVDQADFEKWMFRKYLLDDIMDEISQKTGLQFARAKVDLSDKLVKRGVYTQEYVSGISIKDVLDEVKGGPLEDTYRQLAFLVKERGNEITREIIPRISDGRNIGQYAHPPKKMARTQGERKLNQLRPDFHPGNFVVREGPDGKLPEHPTLDDVVMIDW